MPENPITSNERVRELQDRLGQVPGLWPLVHPVVEVCRRGGRLQQYYHYSDAIVLLPHLLGIGAQEGLKMKPDAVKNAIQFTTTQRGPAINIHRLSAQIDVPISANKRSPHFVGSVGFSSVIFNDDYRRGHIATLPDSVEVRVASENILKSTVKSKIEDILADPHRAIMTALSNWTQKFSDGMVKLQSFGIWIHCDQQYQGITLGVMTEPNR